MKKTLLLLSLVTVCACSELTFSEPEPILSVDALELVEARNAGKDTLYITTNRSWSAHFTTPETWVNLVKEGGRNMDKVTRTFALPIEFEANEGTDERSASICITCGEEGLSKTVKITQQ